MLIDAHMHVFPPGSWCDQFRWAIAVNWARSRLPFRDPNEVFLRIGEAMYDPEGEKWAQEREYLGIDIAVNQVLDYGFTEGWGGECPISVEELNRQSCLLAQKYPGKYYAFVGVNPKRHNAVEILERGVKEWGAKGLKLLPTTGFYPNDRVCYRLYEKCAELGVPVSIHTGGGNYRYMKYANPVLLDEPAKDFPELEFIVTHSGGGIGGLWEEAVTVATMNPNMNLDLTEWQPTVIRGGRLGKRGKYKDHVPMFIDILDIMRNRLNGGCINILFGTDHPTIPIEITKEWVDLFKNLPAVAAQYDYDFSQEEADLICYKNAARIMKLDIETI